MGHHNNQITIKDILSKHNNMYDVSYMFTQPITLRFDGETLQIYENGLELDGYDARSGKVAKRKEIPAKSVNTENNQTLNTVANEEDNVTQAEEKNNLNFAPSHYTIIIGRKLDLPSGDCYVLNKLGRDFCRENISKWRIAK